MQIHVQQQNIGLMLGCWQARTSRSLALTFLHLLPALLYSHLAYGQTNLTAAKRKMYMCVSTSFLEAAEWFSKQ